MTRQELIQTLRTARASVEQGKREDLHKSLGVSEQRDFDLLVSEAKALSKSLLEARMMGPTGSVCPTCNGSGRI